MEKENQAVVLDLRHHRNCEQSSQKMFSRLTAGFKISELLESLGSAGSLEVKFGTCPEAN